MNKSVVLRREVSLCTSNGGGVGGGVYNSTICTKPARIKGARGKNL